MSAFMIANTTAITNNAKRGLVGREEEESVTRVAPFYRSDRVCPASPVRVKTALFPTPRSALRTPQFLSVLPSSFLIFFPHSAFRNTACGDAAGWTALVAW